MKLEYFRLHKGGDIAIDVLLGKNLKPILLKPYVAALFMAAVVLSIANLGSVYLFDVDEAVFAQAAKEMLLSGDWINPTYNGINRYDKPILIYWLMALSYKVFGINEFAARLPSVISALLLALAVFLFLRQQLAEDRAEFALMCFVLSPYYFVYSRAAVTDMTLTLFIALSLFCFYSGAGLRHKVGFHVFSALAFLTKGLIGIVFPFGIAIAYIIATQQWHRLRVVFSPIGIGLFMLTAAPWYIAQYQRNGMEFIEQFFLKHHFRRYTDVISGHQGPFYYYFIALFAGLMPWSLLLPLTIKKGWRQRDSLYGFALLWLGFVVLFFSFSTTKLPNYILPSIPAGILLISGALEDCRKKWFKLSIAISSAVLIVLALASPSIAERYATGSLQWLYWTIPISLLTLIVLWISDSRLIGGIMPLGLGLSMFMLLLLIAIKGLPLASEKLQGSLYQFSVYAGSHIASSERIFVYKINQPSIVFYSDRKVTRAGSYQEAEDILKDKSLKIAITRTKYREDMLRLGFRLIKSREDYALFER